MRLSVRAFAPIPAPPSPTSVHLAPASTSSISPYQSRHENFSFALTFNLGIYSLSCHNLPCSITAAIAAVSYPSHFRVFPSSRIMSKTNLDIIADVDS